MNQNFQGLRKLIPDFTQFNHQVCRAKFIKEETGIQFFKTTTKVGSTKQIFSTEIGGRFNPLLRVGDKGDLKIVVTEKVSSFLFIPDRQGARNFGGN